MFSLAYASRSLFMSTMLSYFASDVESVESDLPVTFTFSGTDYTGQKSESMESLAMQEAGYQSEIEFDLICRSEIFTTAPVVRDLITISSVIYRVLKKTPSQDGVVLTLSLTKNV